MRIVQGFALIALAAVCSITAIACGDDDVDLEPGSSSGTNTDAGASSSSSGASGSSGDAGSNEFVEFVKNQITNETKNDTAPATLNDKTFVESERGDLFDPAFFAGSYE